MEETGTPKKDTVNEEKMGILDSIKMERMLITKSLTRMKSVFDKESQVIEKRINRMVALCEEANDLAEAKISIVGKDVVDSIKGQIAASIGQIIGEEKLMNTDDQRKVDADAMDKQ